ncbi:MAG TPA: hypothetical protein VGJ36_09760 [Gemmatimonadales bacterium]
MTDHRDSTDESEAILSSTDRRRIIAEEEFRKATAKRLDREMESPGRRLGRTLNTPAMLWLLSTVVVGLGTWLYQRHAEAQQRADEQHKIAVRTTDELLYRLAACDRVRPNSTRDDIESLLSSVIGLRPLHEEFKGRNLADVYYQFCSLDGHCRLAPDSLSAIAEDIRRTTWPVIVGQPIDRPLKDRTILPKLEAFCSRLSPIRGTAPASLRL